ncbi:MAG TPA: hypothetical protein ENJ09_16120 [Planctomycetes bacterium]|nr:hypothetical protein [Planctomycetota bacterium]
MSLHSLRIALCVFLLTLFGVPAVARGEQDTEGIAVRVTAVDGQLVYLDLGADAGILRGDRVELHTTGGKLLVGVVQTVSRQSARASFTDPLDEVDAGTVGEVIVPLGRGKKAPAHPPWSAPLESVDEDVPLLAPAHGRAPAERERTFRGRVYTGLDRTDDSRFDQTDQTLATGMDLELGNPFRRGGEMRISIDTFLREVTPPTGPSTRDTRIRVDRASYGVPLRRDTDTGSLYGRFLHTEFAELGIVDGVEFVRRLGSGAHLGVSAGFLPLTVDQLSTGDDFETSVFYRRSLGHADRVVLGGAYQKTWHKGAADRDLFLGKLDLRATDRIFVRAGVWVDYYGATDTLKSSGFEVTQAQLSTDWRATDATGLGLFASQRRWPDVEMDAYRVSEDTIRDGLLRSLGGYAWTQPTERTRIDGRASAWKDQDDAGGSASLRFTLRRVWSGRGDASAEVFTTRGSFSDSNGWRLSTWRGLGPGTLRLYWSHSTQDQIDFVGTQSSLGRDSLRASFDATFGRGWDVSTYVERSTGDEQDSTSLGFQLQRRF